MKLLFFTPCSPLHGVDGSGVKYCDSFRIGSSFRPQSFFWYGGW